MDMWTPQREPSATISRTHVRYAEVVTERPRIALRQPRSLQPEQMGQLTVSTPAVPQRVRAWILWEDGVEELVPAQCDCLDQTGGPGEIWCPALPA